jgi:hypothetical protein
MIHTCISTSLRYNILLTDSQTFPLLSINAQQYFFSNKHLGGMLTRIAPHWDIVPLFPTPLCQSCYYLSCQHLFSASNGMLPSWTMRSAQ